MGGGGLNGVLVLCVCGGGRGGLNGVLVLCVWWFSTVCMVV